MKPPPVEILQDGTVMGLVCLHGLHCRLQSLLLLRCGLITLHRHFHHGRNLSIGVIVLHRLTAFNLCDRNTFPDLKPIQVL